MIFVTGTDIGDRYNKVHKRLDFDGETSQYVILITIFRFSCIFGIAENLML